MKNLIIDICLISFLAVNSQANGAERVERRSAEIAFRRAEVQKVLGEIRGRISLHRSVNEFFDEMGFFDSHLYGRLRSKENYQEKANELKTDIDYLNTHLIDLRDKQGNGQFGPGPERNPEAEINQLETMINTMRNELDLFQAKSLLEGGTEMLDGSRLEKSESVGWLGSSLNSLLDRAEYYSNMLESLEEEQKKLEKKAVNPAE